MPESTNDNRHCALVQLTNTPVPDADTSTMLNEWLSTLTGVSSHTNDLWHVYFDQLNIPTGQLNGRSYRWLSSIGFNQPALTDKWNSFWKQVCSTGVWPVAP